MQLRESLPPDVYSLLFTQQPITTLMRLRRICKSFKSGISLLLNERLKELSEQDFNGIKKNLNKDKQRIFFINAIPHEKLKETVALVHASSGYILWERWKSIDIFTIEKSICSLHDFLLCRNKYIEAINFFDKDKILISALLSRIKTQSEAIQKILRFSSDSWVSKYEIKTIEELIKSLPEDKINVNDRFYLALYHMFLNRTKSSCELGVHELLQLPDHEASRWILGEYYFREGLTPLGITHMRHAANSGKLDFVYRFAMFLYRFNSITYEQEINNLLIKCMKANYPIAYYSYGLMIKKKNSADQAFEYFEKGASLGCVESQRELDKIFHPEKVDKSCIIQ